MMFKIAATSTLIWLTGQSVLAVSPPTIAKPDAGVLELLVTQVPALAVLVYLVTVFLKDRRASERDSRQHSELMASDARTHVESIVKQTTDTAKECHAIQKESVQAMHAVTQTAERLDNTVDRLTRTLERNST